MSRTIEQGMVLSERMEIRVIGTVAQLERASVIISASYDIHYQSELYSCKGSTEQHRQYYKVSEKEGEPNGQDD